MSHFQAGRTDVIYAPFDEVIGEWRDVDACAASSCAASSYAGSHHHDLAVNEFLLSASAPRFVVAPKRSPKQ